MSSIDPTGQLVALIRQQVADARGGPVARRAPTAESQSATRRKPAPGLAELVAKRVRAIQPDDPQRNRKAFRVFLESALLGELGGDLINDPAFYRLVDQVQRTMEDDVELRAHIEEAGHILLATRAPS